MSRPLPSELSCELTVKAGDRLEECRDKGVAISFDVQVEEGYDVLVAKSKAGFVAQHKLKVRWRDGLEIFIKVSKHANQKGYIKLDSGNFLYLLEKSWRNAKRRDGGQDDFFIELFVYVDKAKKVKTTTLHRATASRVQQVLPRVRSALEAANIPFGPATLRYAATAQARLPDDNVDTIPGNTTFHQLQHIDSLQSEAPTADTTRNEIAPVQTKLNDSVVTLHMRVHDICRAVGLPLYPLCPPYRQPPAYVAPPAVNTTDVDHASSDDECAEDLDHGQHVSPQ